MTPLHHASGYAQLSYMKLKIEHKYGDTIELASIKKSATFPSISQLLCRFKLEIVFVFLQD